MPPSKWWHVRPPRTAPPWLLQLLALGFLLTSLNVTGKLLHASTEPVLDRSTRVSLNGVEEHGADVSVPAKRHVMRLCARHSAGWPAACTRIHVVAEASLLHEIVRPDDGACSDMPGWAGRVAQMASTSKPAAHGSSTTTALGLTTGRSGCADFVLYGATGSQTLVMQSGAKTSRFKVVGDPIAVDSIQWSEPEPMVVAGTRVKFRLTLSPSSPGAEIDVSVEGESEHPGTLWSHGDGGQPVDRVRTDDAGVVAEVWYQGERSTIVSLVARIAGLTDSIEIAVEQYLPADAPCRPTQCPDGNACLSCDPGFDLEPFRFANVQLSCDGVPVPAVQALAQLLVDNTTEPAECSGSWTLTSGRFEVSSPPPIPSPEGL